MNINNINTIKNMKNIVDTFEKKLVMVEYLRKTYPDSFFLDPEYDFEIEGIDPLNESILYNEVGVIHTAMHLMKDDYGYDGNVYNHSNMDEDKEQEWADYYDQIQDQILHIFHRHDGEQDQWGGKVAPTLYHDLEYEAGMSLSENTVNNEALKERANRYEEILNNNQN